MTEARPVKWPYRPRPRESMPQALPILMALALRPMSITELASGLMVTRRTMTRLVKRLAAAGYIIRRAEDKRWVTVVTVQLPKIGTEAAVGVPEEVEVQPEPLNAPVRIASHYNVPEKIAGHTVVVTVRNKCVECGAATHLRYGPHSVCVHCAQAASGIRNRSRYLRSEFLRRHYGVEK